MGNGTKEPVEFTRGDSDRLCIIEVQQKETITKVDILATKIDIFLQTHATEHSVLRKQIDTNSRFRHTVKHVLFWLISSSVGLALCREIVRSVGWLN